MFPLSLVPERRFFFLGATGVCKTPQSLRLNKTQKMDDKRRHTVPHPDSGPNEGEGRGGGGGFKSGSGKRKTRGSTQGRGRKGWRGSMTWQKE